MPATTETERPSIDEIAERCRVHADRLNGLNTRDPERRDDAWEAERRQARQDILSDDALLTTEMRLAEMNARAALAQLEEQARTGAHQAGGDTDTRSMGQAFIQSEQYHDRSGVKTAEMEYQLRTLLTSSTSSPASGLWIPTGQPFMANVRQRRLFLDDLIPTVRTTLASVPYIKELNAAALEGGASAVAEGSAKPEVTMTFTSDDAPIRKIAAWVPVTEEIISDAPGLADYIDTRLLYMLAIRKEQQLLLGDGNAPNIRGILAHTDRQTGTAVSNDLPATIGNAAAKIENVDGMADGIVMNPLDFWTAAVTRHATQVDGDGSAGLPWGNAPTTMWGFPIVRTRAMSQGRALVGAFGTAAAIWSRAEATIRTTDSHSDYFTKNLIVILAELRCGLAIYRPDWFVDTTV